MEDLESEEVELLSAPAVKEYADDLRSLLSKGSIMEQKSFLRSFVKRIEVNLPDVAIDYTIPLESKKVEPLAREVLPFAQNGSPGRTRTCGTVVNSHLLYRLSYRGICYLENDGQILLLLCPLTIEIYMICIIR